MEELFEIPHVDVPLKDAIILKDQAVYSGQRYTLAEFVDTGIVDGTNNQFVDINLSIKDEDGNVINTYLIPAGSSEADPQTFIDDTVAHAEANHPIGYRTTQYYVDYTIEPDYTKGTLTQADKIEKNNQEATAYVYIPTLKEKDDSVDENDAVDLTVHAMDDFNDSDVHIAMEWKCLEETSLTPSKEPSEVTYTLTDITPGSSDSGHEIGVADETYVITHDTDFRVRVTVPTEAATYALSRMNGQDMEEGMVDLPATTKTLDYNNNEVSYYNSKNIDSQNVKTAPEETGKFTIHVNRPSFTLDITKQFSGDYAIPEAVEFVFTDTLYETEVRATIGENGFTGLSGTTAATLTVGREYTLTEVFSSAGENADEQSAKDEQYATVFTPDGGWTGTSTFTQEPGSNVVTNEAFTFTVAQEPDGNLALTVINTDVSEPPPVTGISDNENRFNPYYLAAAIAALLGSGGTAYVVKRKKETA